MSAFAEGLFTVHSHCMEVIKLRETPQCLQKKKERATYKLSSSKNKIIIVIITRFTKGDIICISLNNGFK